MAAENQSDNYTVLARRYRPRRLEDLIGQEGLSQTLSNALKTERLHHAYILTGLRGVGKTTTARIIALAVNCETRAEGTPDPCGQCGSCQKILEGRHMDVMEMDAASHTGVDDMRDLISAVGYRPTSGRKKIYIIDEVHMLSKNAFNALLKTLEEPPGHVIFILATTEIHKVPATIISRCQRFDLRRIETEALVAHFKDILAREKLEADDDALHAIARAADGSVRDGLSLLDRAISMASSNDKGEKENLHYEVIRTMLHLNDRQAVFNLLEEALKGGTPERLIERAGEFYQAGADPLQIIHDLMDLTHLLTRLKMTSKPSSAKFLSEFDLARASEMAGALPLPVLIRLWQILLKGESEIRTAPDGLQALEMILLRVMYGAALPDSFVMKEEEKQASLPTEAPKEKPTVEEVPEASKAPRASETSEESPPWEEEAKPDKPIPNDFTACIALFETHNEMALFHKLSTQFGLVSYAPGVLILSSKNGDNSDDERVVEKARARLTQWTHIDWSITLDKTDNAHAEKLSLKEHEHLAKEAEIEKASQNPIVKETIKLFPEAKIRQIGDG